LLDRADHTRGEILKRLRHALGSAPNGLKKVSEVGVQSLPDLLAEFV
jgi:hypothetical protein